MKTKLFLSFLFLFLPLLALAQTATFTPTATPTPLPTERPFGDNPNTYYVNEFWSGASDSNDGSLGQPWKTMDHALANTSPGDTLYIRAGAYGRVVIDSSEGGSPGNWKNLIFLRDSNDSSIPFYNHLDFSTNLSHPSSYSESSPSVANAHFDSIALNNVSYLRIRGLEISGDWSNESINFDNSDYISIEDCLIHDGYRGVYAQRPGSDNVWITRNRIWRVAGSGIQAHGSNWILEGNHVSNTINYRLDTGQRIRGDVDVTRFFGSNMIWRNNHLGPSLLSEQYSNTAPHIDSMQTFGVNTWQYADNILIEKNILEGVVEGSENAHTKAIMISDDPSGQNDRINNITIRNNIFIGNHTAGIFVSRDGNDIYVVNNTFYRVIYPSNNWASFIYEQNGGEDLVGINNLLIDTNGRNINSLSGARLYEIDNEGGFGEYLSSITFPSDIDGPDGQWNLGENNLPTINSYLAGSVPADVAPAWAADTFGTFDGTWTEDMLGNQRPVGDWSIGAFQDLSALPTATPTPTNTPFPTFTFTPRPTFTPTSTHTFTPVPTPADATPALSIIAGDVVGGASPVVIGDTISLEATVDNIGSTTVTEQIMLEFFLLDTADILGYGSDSGPLVAGATVEITTTGIEVPFVSEPEQIVAIEIIEPTDIVGSDDQYFFPLTMQTATGTPTATNTPTPTSTHTFTPTSTGTNTPTHTPTFTPTFTPSWTPTWTPVNPTWTPTATFTPTNTPTATATPTPTPTGTLTSTPTPTPTPTGTLTPTPTFTHTPTATATPKPLIQGPVQWATQPLLAVERGYRFSADKLIAGAVLNTSFIYPSVPSATASEEVIEEATWWLVYSAGDRIFVNDATGPRWHNGRKWIAFPWDQRTNRYEVGNIDILETETIDAANRTRIYDVTFTVPPDDRIGFYDKVSFTYFVASASQTRTVIKNPFRSRGVLASIREASPPYRWVLTDIRFPFEDDVEVRYNAAPLDREFIMSLIGADLVDTIGHATDTVVQATYPQLPADRKVLFQFSENGGFYRNALVDHSYADQVLTVTTAAPLGPDALMVKALVTPFYWDLVDHRMDLEHSWNSRDVFFQLQAPNLKRFGIGDVKFVKHDILSVSMVESASGGIITGWPVPIDVKPFDGSVSSPTSLEIEDGIIINAN